MQCRPLIPEHVRLLKAMRRSLAAEHACIEGKAVHRERTAGEQPVHRKIFADLRGRCVLQAGQGDMRRVFPIFQLDTHLEQTGGDLALEDRQGLASLDPGPKDTGLAAGWEKPHTSHAQIEWRDGDPGQGLADIEKRSAVDLADETEGEVELLRRRPAGIGQAAAERGELFPDRFRWIDGDKKPFVHGSIRFGCGRQRWRGGFTRLDSIL